MSYNPTSNTTDTTATGTLTALNSTVVLTTGGVGTSIFEITGTWVGTITFEGSNNAFTTSQAISAVYLGGVQTQASTTTANGYFSVITAGFAQVRAKMTAYTSGTATVLANGSAVDRVVVAVQGNPNNNQTLATLNGGGSNSQIKDDTFYGEGVTSGVLSSTARLWNGTGYDRAKGTGGALNITGAQVAAATTAWTSATGVNTANTISVANYNTVSVTMSNTSTMTAGVLTFEVSPDGTTWFPIALARIDSYTVETTYTLNAVTNRAWSTSVDGFTNFRVRLSTVITGTGTATVSITPQTFAIEPIVSVGQATAANLNATVTGTITSVTSITNAVNIGTKTTGGATPFTLISAATTNATSVKASAGTLYGIYAYNNGAATAYLKLYNKATAPTVGTDTAVMTFMLPAGGGSNIPIPAQGIAFGTGIAYAITGLGTTADTTAVALAQVFVNGSYI